MNITKFMLQQSHLQGSTRTKDSEEEISAIAKNLENSSQQFEAGNNPYRILIKSMF